MTQTRAEALTKLTDNEIIFLAILTEQETGEIEPDLFEFICGRGISAEYAAARRDILSGGVGK